MCQISNYELELMKIIWMNGGTALYADIAAGLESRGNTWTKNTIITLLSRLVEKGVLKTNKIGRKNKYIAVLSIEKYKSQQTMQFIDRVYEGDMKNFIAMLIDKDLLSSNDYEELFRRWQERGKEYE